MSTSPVRIGELAAEFHLNPKTLRYYESIGLLPAPGRSTSGYRQYGAADRARLHFIVQAKAVGLRLEDIAEVLQVRERGEPPCAHVRSLLDARLAEVDRHLQALTRFRAELLALRVEADVEGCGGSVCGIIERSALGRA
ncbi:heavy metal-responsive transcriptional regulator [Deinococcus sp. YIM 77859]|uniref:heavy metal-responsive transcriptional regulator n=1 Tax=Deinococcus sp. YIM 77859 TaxID=1540221 RepID=UPI000550A34E|nr:heavy metal-responsive transcriptional regulator [Deinococcus sp. YIM 77859]